MRGNVLESAAAAAAAIQVVSIMASLLMACFMEGHKQFSLRH